MKRLLGFIAILLLFVDVAYGADIYRYRVYLKDKGNSGYRLDRAEEFLSADAIERRRRHGIALSESDMPISQAYIDSLAARGGKYVVSSRWMSTVVVSLQDTSLLNGIASLPMVDSVKLVWRGSDMADVESMVREERRYKPDDALLSSPYGYANKQVAMLKGERLHKMGFKGEGMRVAVIDEGFRNVDMITLFDSINIVGTYNVSSPSSGVYHDGDHGTKVLSCLAANSPGVMLGTAPAATYWLIRSEDSHSEFPIEEDYWAAAVEYADSVGVDVISSSLGYFSFDDSSMNYIHAQLDGKSALISRVASIASSKGLLVFCSAGNEGSGDWGKITFPADADGIVSVGAVTDRKKRSSFSSMGFTADGRVKPDMVAMGSACCVVDPEGEIRFANGTSFATPILAGLAAALWQAFPEVTNMDIIDAMRRSCSNYKRPDAERGYGVPDMYKAYKILKRHGSEAR